MLRSLVLAATLAPLAACAAWAQDAANYVPTQSGNSWSYDRVDAQGNHTSLPASVFSQSGEWAEISNWLGSSCWVETQGSIVYESWPGGGDASFDLSLAAQGQSVSSAAGSFVNCVRVDFTSGYSVWLAPGVGVVKWTDSSGTATIASAQIGTRVLPAVGSPVTVPTSSLDSSPYIDLTLQGSRGPSTGTFLFDTGANTSGIDGNWLSTAGISYTSGTATTVGGTTGTSSVATAVVPELTLGNGYFTSPSFLIEDFSHFISPAGKTEVGLLGTDFIDCFAVTVDYTNAQVTLALSAERGPPPAYATPVPVTFPSGLPTVTVQIGGTSVPCRIDTGDSYEDTTPLLDVNEAEVSALKAAGVQLTQVGSITVAGISGQDNLALLSTSAGLTLSIGSASIEGVTLVVHDQGTLASYSTPLVLAGSSLLARFGSFQLDPFDQKIWIPGK
jgi:hypothetical protein